MEETYTFDARIAERWPQQIQVVPDDRAAFLAYLERAQLTCDPFWHGDEIYVTVGNQALIQNSEGAERVRYSVQAKATRAGRQMWGVGLEPI